MLEDNANERKSGGGGGGRESRHLHEASVGATAAVSNGLLGLWQESVRSNHFGCYGSTPMIVASCVNAAPGMQASPAWGWGRGAARRRLSLEVELH